MKKKVFTGQSRSFHRLLLALALVLAGLALLPPGAANSQTAITFNPATCCTAPGTVGVSWSSNEITISGGKTPYTITVSPSWVSYSLRSGNRVTLSGTPPRAGSTAITMRVTDSDGVVGTFNGTLEVNKADPTIQIIDVTSSYLGGAIYMVNFPVTVRVQFTGSAVADPLEAIVVSGSDADGPSCGAVIDADTRLGECDLVYTTDGPQTISVTYPGDDNYNAAPLDPLPPVTQRIHVAPFHVPPALTAGRTHTCFQNADGKYSCWGKDDADFLDSDGYPELFQPMLAVSAGGYHNCGINLDGTVQCWGDTPDIQTYPNQPGRRFIEISAGRDFACAIDTRGNRYCWGDLPAGITAYKKGPFKNISAGSLHVCALNRGDSSPVCWGDTAYEKTIPPPGLTGLKAISAGNNHTCAIKADGGLSCWGKTFTSTPTPAITGFTEVQSGFDYSCGQLTSGKLMCWGDRPPTVNENLVVNGFTSGYAHTCAWIENTSEKTLSCWGWNDYGQAPRLWLSPAVLTENNTYIPLGSAWSQAFTYGGGRHSYSLTLQPGAPSGMALNAGTVTWTPTDLGDVPFSLTVSEVFETGVQRRLPLELYPLTQSYPLRVQNPVTTTTLSLENVDPGNPTANAGTEVVIKVQVSKAQANAVPLLSGTVFVQSLDGAHSVSCQAEVNSAGMASCSIYFAHEGAKAIQASYSGNTFYHGSTASPAASLNILPVTVTPVVSAGNQFSCSINSEGEPDCWGKSDTGQTAPEESIYSQISASDAFACGRTLSAAVYCWGWNGYGLNNPVTGTNFAQVATGSMHACALSSDGTRISCWGNSADGRTTVPASGSVYTALSAGNNHTCALKSDGRVTCWGQNTYGQASAPTEAFTSISAGGTFTCGIRSGGGLSCWGGTGVIDSIRSVPAGSFRALDAGYAHACAVRVNDGDTDPNDGDDTVVCWGDTANGKAAAPAYTFRSVSAGRDHSCGIREKDETLESDILQCWGGNAWGQAPTVTIAPTALGSISAGENTSIQITASGGRTGQFSYTSSTLPDGLHIVNSSSKGFISGTPVDAGDYNFTVQAIEGGVTPALMAEASYQLIVRSSVSVQIQSVTPLAGMVGKPVTVQVQVRETPGNFFSTPPLGTVTVQSSDGKTCQAALAVGDGVSEGICTIFFTTSGAKELSAVYPGDHHFLPGSTTAPQAVNITAFAHAPQVRTSAQKTYLHFADGSSVCLGTGCTAGGLAVPLTALDVSDNLACGLGLDGHARCRDGISPSATAAAVLNHGPYLGLAVGAAHACAIQLNGAVFCWGDNTAGQASPPPGVFIALSAADARTCGIRSTGELACWGGIGMPPAGSFTQVRVENRHACAINQAGEVLCWGDNTSGQTDAPASGVFRSVSVGDEHTCALEQAGQVLCWGQNADLQANAPYGVFATLDSAGDHSCALRDAPEGPRLTCWGGNLSGEAPQILVSALDQTELVAARSWEFAFNPTGGNRPYQGSKPTGQLPMGIEMEVTLSPAGVKLYGTPLVPGDYPFVIRWEDTPSSARPIPLVLEKAYTLRITGADLAVRITPAGKVAMLDNSFHFVYTFQNLSALSVPSVQAAIAVPPELVDITWTGIDDCTLLEGTLTCSLAMLDPGVDQALTLTGTLPPFGVESLSTSVEVQPLLENWPELAPANNTAALTIPVAYQTVIFTDDFDCSARDAAWSAGTCTTAPSEITYLGDFAGSSEIRLQVGDLTPHKWVEVAFDLYVVGPWSGNNPADPENPSRWFFGETGQPALLDTTFCNDSSCEQAYPRGYPEGAYPGQTGAANTNALGYTDTADSRYHMVMRFDHTGSLLDVTFRGAGLPEGALWGIDNVQVTIGSGIKFLYLPVLMR